MSVNRQELRDFLAANIKTQPPDQGALDAVMADLEPFFVMAETGKLTLKPEAELNSAEIAGTISAVIGKPVNEIVFASAAKPFPKPRWMTETKYQNYLEDIFEISLGTSFGAILEDNWIGLSRDCHDAFTDALSIIINENLEDDLNPSLQSNFGNNLGESLGDSLMFSFFCYLWFFLIGNEEMTAKMLKLINLLPSAVPLKEKEDEPGTWIVLTA